jgi:hypothetical protein
VHPSIPSPGTEDIANPMMKVRIISKVFMQLIYIGMKEIYNKGSSINAVFLNYID